MRRGNARNGRATSPGSGSTSTTGRSRTSPFWSATPRVPQRHRGRPAGRGAGAPPRVAVRGRGRARAAGCAHSPARSRPAQPGSPRRSGPRWRRRSPGSAALRAARRAHPERAARRSAARHPPTRSSTSPSRRSRTCAGMAARLTCGRDERAGGDAGSRCATTAAASDPSEAERGLGLDGMGERMRRYGGTLEIESAPGGPTSVRARLVRRAVASLDVDPGSARLVVGSGEMVRVRVAGRLGAVPDAELAVDVRQMELDRLLGDAQLAPRSPGWTARAPPPAGSSAPARSGRPRAPPSRRRRAARPRDTRCLRRPAAAPQECRAG